MLKFLPRRLIFSYAEEEASYAEEEASRLCSY